MSIEIEKIELSRRSRQFSHVVPSSYWQVAVPIDGEVLVGCTVVPGFEFSDFCVIDPKGDERKQLLKINMDMAKFIF